MIKISFRMGLKLNKQQLINKLRLGDTRTLNIFYKNHKWKFINHFRKKFQDYEEGKYIEVFHESVVKLLERLREGVILNCSVKTFLYGIARNLFREEAREAEHEITELPLEDKHHKYYGIDEIEEFELQTEMDFDTKENHLRIIEEALTLLKSPDKEVMQDYLGGENLMKIVKEYNFNDLKHLYKQKHRYQNRLKNIALKIYLEEQKKYYV